MAAAPPGPIAVVSGTAGVGKTALAIHWAHRVRDRFPDGQLYVNLRGFDPTSIGGPGRRARRLPGSRSASRGGGSVGGGRARGAVRSLLADRRMLLVLDNARNAGQVAPLLPSAATCHVVITSRSQLQG